MNAETQSEQSGGKGVHQTSYFQLQGKPVLLRGAVFCLIAFFAFIVVLFARQIVFGSMQTPDDTDSTRDIIAKYVLRTSCGVVFVFSLLGVSTLLAFLRELGEVVRLTEIDDQKETTGGNKANEVAGTNETKDFHCQFGDHLNEKYNTPENSGLFKSGIFAAVSTLLLPLLAYFLFGRDEDAAQVVFFISATLAVCVTSYFAGRFWESALVVFTYAVFAILWKYFGPWRLLPDELPAIVILSVALALFCLVLVRGHRVRKTYMANYNGLGLYREFGSDRIILTTRSGSILCESGHSENRIKWKHMKSVGGGLGKQAPSSQPVFWGFLPLMLWHCLVATVYPSEQGEMTVCFTDKSSVLAKARILFARNGYIHIVGLDEQTARQQHLALSKESNRI